eukprot:TRINITY_DN1721_c0_g3_i1.p1 TRINITY_DN1721_c0_g3~~TRINITY_DN1721_c0_g3_i1.p1  ORF type:complete len:395 (+),score=88.49 TRINITY_DN1721_c0_g3_i1:180-1364(+)
MGCCGSAQPNAQVPHTRRRLSVGNIDGTYEEEDVGTTESNRGLITVLSESDIIAMLASGSGKRKFSIGSMTDQEKQSFVNKTINQQGDAVDWSSMGLGYTCRKGLKPESPNQDSWGVMKLDGNYSIYGVYDGHGQKGHDVSQFVKENMPKLILRDQRFRKDGEEMRALMREVFIKTQTLVSTADRMKQLNAQMSGTTATVVVHDLEQSKLCVAHVADSTCVLGSYKEGTKDVIGVALTRDHKPDLKDERERIEKAGGRVVFDGYANYRVYAKNGRYPGLNMSRCLGDLLGHADAGCSCEPEVSERIIGAQDHVLLLCSDGVWEFISPQEAVEIVCEFDHTQADKAANKLAKEAWDRWIAEEGGTVVDDITVVLVFLQQQVIACSPPNGENLASA